MIERRTAAQLAEQPKTLRHHGSSERGAARRGGVSGSSGAREYRGGGSLRTQRLGQCGELSRTACGGVMAPLHRDGGWAGELRLGACVCAYVSKATRVSGGQGGRGVLSWMGRRRRVYACAQPHETHIPCCAPPLPSLSLRPHSLTPLSCRLPSRAKFLRMHTSTTSARPSKTQHTKACRCAVVLNVR